MGSRSRRGRQSSASRRAVSAFSSDPDPFPDCHLPEVISDRFESIRPIGSGGMGRVYQAWDKKLERNVALKFIHAPDDLARARFLREAHATAKVEHPNVVRIHDVMELGDVPFIVMELLSGRTLREIEKPMEWPRALQLAVALTFGLGAVHRKGIVHRDIKPSNVMLTDDDELKLFDFGLAKFARRGSTRRTLPDASLRASQSPALTTLRDGEVPDDMEPQELTASGILIGTPGFIAPESWGREATMRSDVYSTGAVLFELCTGRAVYPDLATHALCAAVQRQDAPLVTELVPTIHPVLAEIIARCLSRNPMDRYPSGKELHRALRDLQDGASAGSVRGSQQPITASSMAWREHGSLVVSVISADDPADSEWSAYLEVCRRKVQTGPISVLVVTAGGVPTKQQRMALRGILPEGTVPAAIVSDAAMVHSVVTALSWRNTAIKEFTDLDAALRYLGVDDGAGSDVRRLVSEMQHEVA